MRTEMPHAEKCPPSPPADSKQRCHNEKENRKHHPGWHAGVLSEFNLVQIDQQKKYWNRAKCPYCGGNRVKKNSINAFSDNNAKEYRCTSFECGKQFNSEQVKEYEQVEVKERGPRPEYNPRLTD